MTVLLLAQAGVMYSSIRPEAVPPGRPLADFPTNIGPWTMRQEGLIDSETQAILQADDLLTRVYGKPSTGQVADFFIAAFRSQRNGKAPHSPKNCLPGNGWTPEDQNEIRVDTGIGQIPVNRYVIEHGDSRSVVLYWYQSRDRAVASEYRAKFWVVADAIRLNRTDTALIRVIVPVVDRNVAAADKTALEFVKSIYGLVRQFLPA